MRTQGLADNLAGEVALDCSWITDARRGFYAGGVGALGLIRLLAIIVVRKPAIKDVGIS